MAFPNNYPGRCDSCGTHVAPKAGTAFKRGGWRVCCSSEACGRKCGLAPTAGASTERTLRQDGDMLVVRTPRDPAALPLLRALPGARWNPERVAWTCSGKPADLPRVLELAARLSLDVPAELTARAATGTVDEQAAAGRADTVGLYAFQRDGVRFLARRDRALLADDMGCVDGDAEVRLNRAGKGFALSLSELYARFHGSTGWSARIPTRIRALCNGELRLHRVDNVLDKGVRAVVKLTLASGRALRLTPDHEVCTLDGEVELYVAAQDLRPGQQVLCNGRMLGAANPNYKGGRRVDGDGYVRVSGHQAHPRHTTGGVYEHILVAEAMLGRSLSTREHVHHKNGVKHDNRPDNLEVLSTSEHAAEHGRAGGYRRMHGGRTGKGGLVTFVPTIDTVVSVQSDGTAHVYDVVCADPHRNFVANGVVVHNCGKTVEALCAMPEGGKAIVVCPNVVKHNWANEAARWRPDLRVTVLSGRGSFRAPEPGEIVVINYDLLPKAPAKAAKGQPAALLPYDLTGVVLVVDEAHMAKNYKAARTQAIAALARQCAKAWLLTGTPLANRALDLWGVLGAGGMAGEVFGGWLGFVRRFQGHKNKWGGWEFGSPLPEVPELLRRVMLRRTKAEVLPELPAVTYQQIPCNGIDASLRRDLDRAWDAYGDELTGGGLPPFEEFSELRARLAASRIPALTELVEQYEETGTPVLVFSAHRAPVDEIGAREGWAAITGDTPAEQRTEIVARFQRGDLKGVALTIAAGGVGITLTHASTAIFVDLAWRPTDNWQAEDRMRRIGQTADKITVVRLVSDHPLDLHVQDLLVAKIALIQAAVEKTAAYTAPAATASATWTAETDEQLAARLAQRAANVEAAEREVERAEAKSRIARKLANGGGVRQPVELTAEQAQAVRGAFGRLCDVCDGAVEQDGAGFNKPDQGIKGWLLAVGLDDPEALELAYHLVRGYPAQVKDAYPELWS